MKVEYNQLEASWEQDLCGEKLPLVEKPKNKPQLVDAIIKAREILIRTFPSWKEDIMSQLRLEIKKRNNSATDGIVDRLTRARDHPFFHLSVSGSSLSSLYSEKYCIANNEEDTGAMTAELSQESALSLGDVSF